jgi:anti-sigma-K factor RskA
MTEPHANPEDIDLYALDALDGQERREFEAHLRDCSACRHALNTARECVALLALSTPEMAPPPSAKSALLARVHAESRSGKIVRDTHMGVRRRSWGLRFALGFAAAAIILAIATVLLWRNNRQQEKKIQALQSQLHAAQEQSSIDATTAHTMAEVVGAPDTVQIALLQQTGGPPGQAHILYNARMGVLVYLGEIAPAPVDKSYQLWLVPASGAPVSAGLVSGGQQAKPTVVHLQEGLNAKAFAVTVEPRGGEPQPTGPKVLVGLANS